MDELRNRLLEEIRPLICHCAAVLVLLGSVLVVGLFLKHLKLTFPEHESFYTFAELADLWVFTIVLSLFGVYCVIMVALMLLKEAARAFRTGWADR